MKLSYDLDCNIAKTLNIMGDKWTMLVLHRILTGRNTFKAIEENLSNIPTNVLSNRLKLLEKEGLIEQHLYNEHPPRYEYLPSQKAIDFNQVFNAMTIWGSKNIEDCNKRKGHSKCKEDIEIAYYCPCCDKYINNEDIITLEKEI